MGFCTVSPRRSLTPTVDVYKRQDLIYKHLNREAYAEDVLKQYGAELTPYGMVNREDFGPLNEPIPEQKQEQTQEPQMGM